MFQQQQQNDKPDMKGAFNIAYLVMNSHALTCTVFLRRDFGKEAIGMFGIVGLLMVLVYGGLMNSYAMYLYLLAFLLAVVGQRMQTFQNWRKGDIQHSRYNGYPAIALKLFPKLKEMDAKGIEAFMCLGIGWLLTHVDPALGWYVMGGFFSILLSEGISAEIRKQRLQAMRDAEIENRQLASEYEQFRNKGF
eukprot:TRINITY_DN162_c0_g1_i29.p1 TRINITY_DN162_c0_g1~~TRINITY_DN162_c0_g1_i29.p1  ORF type:complete len:192 (-),score=51.23 TRINITY_DN162_c0_g1_i29:427-1002(-)